MKPALTIAELAQVATFGANKLKKAALENVALSAFVGYEIVKDGKVLRVETLAPNPVNEETPIRRFLELEKTVANKDFFTQLEEGFYLANGQLRVSEFADEFITQYSAKIDAKIGYGSDLTLEKVIHNGNGDATVVFSSVKGDKRRPHHAAWSLVDIKEDFNKTILIPRNLFKSYNEFLNLLCTAIGQPRSRFFLKDDPMEVKGDGIDVFVEGNDLVYFGKLTVALPWSGEEVNIIDNAYVEPTEGEEQVVVVEPTPVIADNNMTVTKAGNVLTLAFDRAVKLGNVALENFIGSALDLIKAVAVPVKELELLDLAIVPELMKVVTTSTSVALTLEPGFFNKDVFTMLDDAKTAGPDTFTGNEDGIYRVDFNLNKDAFSSVDTGTIVTSSDLAVKITAFTDISETVTQHTAEDYELATILGVFGDTPIYPA